MLVIAGEGGSGKTSLACQIAQWGLQKQLASQRMLPVLVETELDDKKSLLEVIRGQLNSLTNQADPIAAELVEKLLQRQRILVIVDHLSEMSEETRKQIDPSLSTFQAKALVVTTRLEESFSNVVKTLLKPQRIEGSRLSRFMDTYLEQRHKRHLFEDEDYFGACRRLSGMVGQRNITVLLARLYADQMIEQQEGAGGTLPASIPELMLSYLNQLNSTIEPNHQRSDLQVQADAKKIAWECLKQTYKPTSTKYDTAIAALQNTLETTLEKPDSQDSPKERLRYLETRLRLLQIQKPGNKLRLILDPLAEYLAALWFVDLQIQQTDPADPDAVWLRFFRDIDATLHRTNDMPEAIQGFLLAVRDCCLLKREEVPTQISDTVLTNLVLKAGLDPEVLRQSQEKRRIRLLISELLSPELEYRIRAADDLGKRGAAATPATHNLFGMLENPSQALAARQAAAKALGEIGEGLVTASPAQHEDIAQRLLLLLQDSTADVAIRRCVAEALGRMNAGATELLQILTSDTQPLPLRQGAAIALRQLPSSSGQPVTMLSIILESERVITQVHQIPIWKQPLATTLTLDFVAIPGGKFLMGSPPEEEGRDRYKSSFPELEGVDVESQHQVTVQPFYFSQYPITQAQWRFIATLPKVKQELDPDPANFKNSQHPVECVSWRDAVEFCDRLSQHMGANYRLPSEAEWEYACRAGTTTPFHSGLTLSTDFDNYNGTRSYAHGCPGQFRKQTMAVGSFGVVNAFGLADMHGTVWEWCLDHWHPSSYAGAPTNGNAWVVEGDDRYRMLRGGSWFCVPEDCRSAYRGRLPIDDRLNNAGFRVVCVSPIS
ncbi:MAG: hypothetical protein B0A82_20995 [Alkalinema sp. CACIAM 70d]|nr:MAG: hypothetical protein B0A82_20995 [Alkalinema sp. CACIAM 70d]